MHIHQTNATIKTRPLRDACITIEYVNINSQEINPGTPTAKYMEIMQTQLINEKNKGFNM